MNDIWVAELPRLSELALAAIAVAAVVLREETYFLIDAESERLPIAIGRRWLGKLERKGMTLLPTPANVVAHKSPPPVAPA